MSDDSVTKALLRGAQQTPQGVITGEQNLIPDSGREAADAAYTFMQTIGLDPTPDAVAQLTQAFVPCLRIMCERGYDPNGATWHEGGWMSLVWELRKKVLRLWWRSWINGKVDHDSPPDIINYAGFYMRGAGRIKPWGTHLPPGSGVAHEADIGG